MPGRIAWNCFNAFIHRRGFSTVFRITFLLMGNQYVKRKSTFYNTVRDYITHFIFESMA